MNEQQLLARLESIERRLGAMDESLKIINLELGILSGKATKGNVIPQLIKFVIFPLIVITGALVGVKLFLP